MKENQFFIAIILFLTISACSNKDDEIQLPIGENTAYYYLNGTLVIPKGYGTVPPTIKAIRVGVCLSSNNGLIFWFNNISQTLKLYIKPGVTSVGIYPLNTGSSNIDGCNFNDSFGSFAWRDGIDYLTSLNSGEVNIIKLSADKRKFSGTFKATMVGANGETIQITGGVFDINLDTL